MTTLTEVKERPILFSTPMVKAILEGRKTVTRRIVDIHPELAKDVTKWGYSIFTPEGHISARTKQPTERGHRYGEKFIKLKYGKPGDVLWVRETWSKIHYEGVDEHPTYIYKADGPQPQGIWKPPIYMPRAACRLRLEIVSITVGRLQDITEEDAIKEGIYQEGHLFKDYIKADYWALNAKHSFETLWKSINGADSWNANPFCWVINFKKL